MRGIVVLHLGPRHSDSSEMRGQYWEHCISALRNIILNGLENIDLVKYTEYVKYCM